LPEDRERSRVCPEFDVRIARGTVECLSSASSKETQ
jgi:hypothetical protein